MLPLYLSTSIVIVLLKFAHMVVLPGSEFSEQTMVFELYSEHECQGESIRLAPEIIPKEELGLSIDCEVPFKVGSIKILQAEAGTVIKLYQNDRPAVSVSFPAIDIHQTVCLPTLNESYHESNVDVFVSKAAHVNQNSRFQKVTISKPSPHFWVL